MKDRPNFITLTQLMVICSKNLKNEEMANFFANDIPRITLMVSNMGLKQFEIIEQYQQLKKAKAT